MTRKHLQSNILNFCIIIFLLIITDSCKQEDVATVPDVPIYYELSLTSELADLGVGTLVTITSDTINKEYSIIDYHNKRKYRTNWKTYGKGIILYRNSTAYQAFDLTCTYNAFKDYCALTVEGHGDRPVCPCCKSVFMISMDGYPKSGSNATRPLMQYMVTIVNYGTKLIISK